MPHGSSSCRSKASPLLRTELELLYAKRSALTATIQALERFQTVDKIDRSNLASGLDITAKLCNLTTCRNA
jgi:hypothetical protein